MSNLETGCKAIVIESLCPENVGKIVTVGNFIGTIHEFPACNCVWEISQTVICRDGIERFMCDETSLQRIDGNDGLIEHADKEISISH